MITKKHFILALVALQACAPKTLKPGPAAPQQGAILQVENTSWQDVVVHLDNGGAPIHLGTIPSMRSGRFVIPRAYVNGTSALTLRLRQIGENQRYVLSGITAYPGAIVSLHVAKILRLSTFAVWDDRTM